MTTFFRVGFKALIVLAAVYLFSRSGTALVPMVISFVLAFILYPLARFLARLPLGKAGRRVGMPLGICGAYLTAGLAAAGVMAILLAPLVEEFGKLYKNIPQIMTGIYQLFVEFENHVLLPLANSGIYRQQSDQLFAVLQQAVAGSLTVSFNLLKSLANLSIRAVSRFIELIVVPVLTFYLLKDWRLMIDSFLALISPRHRDSARVIIFEMGAVVSDFLRGQFLLCLIIGVCMFIGMCGLGIEYPLVLGLLAGIAEAIPIIGPVLSAVPAIFLGLSVSSLLGVKVAAFCFLLQQLENHIIVPKVMGGSVKLHPAGVVVSILIAGQLFGVAGMIAALPVIALVKVLMKHFWITEEI